MNDAKSFLASKTLWGLVIAALGAFLPKVGLMPFDSEGANQLASIIAEIVGLVYAGYGRVVAQKSLRK